MTDALNVVPETDKIATGVRDVEGIVAEPGFPAHREIRAWQEYRADSGGEK